MANTSIPQDAQILIPVHYLNNLVREAVRDEFKSKAENDLKEQFLSPEETRNLFKPKISQPTLDSYAAKGWVNKYHLGGRTWYK